MITLWVLVTFASSGYPISYSPSFKTPEACNEFKNHLPVKNNSVYEMLCVGYVNPK